jgi:hydrogenase maturation protease
MPHTLIIGYGNPLRGDDGVGPRAAELLADTGEARRGGVTPPLPNGVQVLVCHQLTIELAPQIAEADRLILIDARATGEPGSIEQCILTPAIPDRSSLTHHIDAQGLLAAAELLYGRAPETVLFTVSGGSFDCGERLTPAVAAALPDLLARIRQAALS